MCLYSKHWDIVIKDEWKMPSNEIKNENITTMFYLDTKAFTDVVFIERSRSVIVFRRNVDRGAWTELQLLIFPAYKDMQCAANMEAVYAVPKCDKEKI